jgi:dihydrofolate synthase/folylpolyglutamate synthase
VSAGEGGGTPRLGPLGPLGTEHDGDPRAEGNGQRLTATPRRGQVDPATLTRLREIEAEIFARRPEHNIDPSLDRIAALTTLLGDPQRTAPVIHITGTNGKTTTARMIETLLRARGLRTGLFTSPHLSATAERIRIDGEPLSAEAFVAIYDELAPYIALVDERQPARLSFFEVLTGMAFAAFADAPVDVAVLEVGLGGTWDSTNVADGAVAVITPIAIDHVAYLGDTVGQIATEKAGIIKPGATAIFARQQDDAAEVLLARAAEVGAAVAREGIEFEVADRELAVGGQLLTLRGLGGEYPEVALPLFGAHQAENAACALAAAEVFAGLQPGAADPQTSQLDEELVRQAFARVTAPGRLEVVRRSPVVIVDSAHNPAGMAVSAEAVTESFAFGTLIAVLAVSADKDVAGICGELEPVADLLVVTQNSSVRSMDAKHLASVAGEVFGPDRVTTASRLDEAIDTAIALADEAAGQDVGSAGVLVTGSVITAGEARVLLGADPRPGGRGELA